jgi:ubiquinone/menaquinone biosynthesis C-methylase UbiE
VNIKKAPNIRIFGIDLNRKLIQIARKNTARLGFKDNLTFQFGNSTGLPFEDSYFDMVVSTGMLHSLKHPSKVFREIYRVLKSDGEAWIFDPAKVCHLVDQEKWAASLNSREKLFLWLFKILKLHNAIETYNRSQVLPMIESANFKEYWIDERKDEIRIKLRK